MKITLLILNIVMLIASLIWLMLDKSIEPLITALGLIAGLITLIYTSTNKGSGIKMSQKGGEKSTYYQAGKDINVNLKDDK